MKRYDNTYLPGLSYLSPTRISKLRECEARYAFSYGPEKLREPGSEATAMGAAFAAALEMGDEDVLLDEYYALRPPLDGFTDEKAWNDTGYRHLALLQTAYAAYRRRFIENLNREATVFSPIGDGRYLQVRLDGVNAEAGYIVEDKLRSGTASRSELCAIEATMGHQITAEIFSWWKVSGNILPVQLRVIKKPDPRKLRALEPGSDELGEFLDDHFAKESTIAVYHGERTVAELSRFYDQLHRDSRVALSLETMRHGLTPTRNTASCHNYGRTCPFLDRCQSGDWPSPKRNNDEDDDDFIDPFL